MENFNKSTTSGSKAPRELVFKEKSQEYAQVIKFLGGLNLRAMCFDGKIRLCHISGRIKRNTRIKTGDIILVALRDFQDDKADIILKYNDDEIRELKRLKLILDLDDNCEELNDEIDFHNI